MNRYVSPTSGREGHSRGRLVAALSVAAGALIGVAFIALSAASAAPPAADGVHVDTAPGVQPGPVARAAPAAVLDEGVNWAAVDPSVDFGPMAVAAYEH